MREITNDNLAVRPSGIDARQHFLDAFDAFDNRETEISAGWIVEFCQRRAGTGGSWAPFALVDLEAFYAKKHRDGFTFNRLTTQGYVVLRGTQCVLTREFVEQCHKAAPAR